MIRHMYIAGVHSSRKGELVWSVARKLGWHIVPRQPREELIDEALIERLQYGDRSAFSILHERLHTRYRASIGEWRIHRRLTRRYAGIHLSDRSPFDVYCYRRALLRLGWVENAACEECGGYETRILRAVTTSCGVFLDPTPSTLGAEFKDRKMDRLRPLEYRSGYLGIAAVEFRRAYSRMVTESGRWTVLRHADPERAVLALLEVAGSHPRNFGMLLDIERKHGE